MIGIEPVSVLFLLIVLGYVVKRKHIVSDTMIKDISALVINVALPSFIVTSMNFDFSMEVLLNSGFLVITSFTVYAGAILFSKVYSKLLRIEGKTKDVHEYICTFSNVGFMGYPVIFAVFGELGVFYAAIYNLSFNLLAWSYGVNLLDRDTREDPNKQKLSIGKRIINLFNPALIAVIIGFVLFLTSTQLPRVIFDTLKMVGNTVTPLSMMCIGFILSEVDTKDVFNDWRIIVTSFIRLIAIPMLVFLVLKGLGKEGFLLTIPVIITAMPAAANTAIIAVRYNSDYHLASKAIFISTLISIVTIPLMIQLVM